MADTIIITQVEEFHNIIGRVPAAGIHLLKEAIDDIAEAIEQESRTQVPIGETGELAEHPVDIGDGVSGRQRRTKEFLPGKRYEVPIAIAKFPHYAKFVHDGTGIYGPTKRPYGPKPPNKHLVFHSLGKQWFLRSVKGQQANPYLERAADIINSTYVPIRMEQLRLELDLLT